MLNFKGVEAQQPIEPPRKNPLKKLGKLLLWLVVALVVVIAALLGLLLVYGDEVKAAVINELNKHLDAEVRIDPKNIDLTIIKTFPDCSVQFKDALMLEALPGKQRDTLLFAGQLNLLFNIRDLWNKNYTIHKIKLQDGVVKLKILKDGRNNYLFWRKSENTPNSGQSSLAFKLEQLNLRHCRLQYENKQSPSKINLQVRSLDLAGNFAETNFGLSTQGQLFVEQITVGERHFIKNKNCRFEVGLDVQGHNYKLGKASIALNQLQLEAQGNFVYKDSLQNLQLRYNAPGLDIASVLSLLPQTFKGSMSDYESKGNFYASGTFNYASSHSFALNSDFGIRNGQVTYKPQGTAASNIQLEGHLQYSSSASKLDLKTIALNLNNDVLKGHCTIADFNNPKLDLQATASLHLENLKNFLPLDTLSILKGGLNINTSISGALSDLQKQTFSTRVNIALDAAVSGLEAQFKGDDRLIAIAGGSVTAQNREIEVKDLAIKRGSSDILLNGRLPGFFNYLSNNNAPLVISGNLFSNYIRLEDFMVKYKASGGAGPLIPANISFQLNAAILKLSYAGFEASAITGEVEIKKQKLMVSDMKLQAMGGEARIDAFADNSGQHLEVVLQSRFSNINISRLFTEFNNFGQSTLQDKHLKGLASADVELAGTWSNQLVADYNSIRATCDLTITQGELIDFKPLLSLSRFVDVQDLQHIKFSALQSSIRIANGVISFPKTVIKNSALNITVSGSHNFNNAIDYHIQLLISDLLAKKRKQANDEEFGPIEKDKDNKRSAFILMTGTVDKPIIKYDHSGLKEKIKTDIKEEKQNIRQVLKEEFGLFKKDTTTRRSKAESNFQLEKPNNNPPKKALQLKKKDEDEDF